MTAAPDQGPNASATGIPAPDAAAPAAAAPAPTHTIKGDLGTGLKHTGPVRIAGSVCAGVTLEIDGALTVSGTIESATVSVTGALDAAGGIVGRGKGRYVTGGHLTSRSIIAATIESKDDVRATVEIANSRIIAGGSLNCESGHIYGGHVTANGGVVCATLGSPGASETIIEVGIDEELRRLGEKHAAEIDANQKRIQKVRSQVEPLMAQQRALTAKQKESATELLYEAGELEEKTLALIKELRGRVGASYARGKAEVVINSMLHPGVVLRFPSFEVKVERAIKGPIKFVKDGKGSAARVVLIDLRDNSEQSIKFLPWTDQLLSALFRSLVVPKPRPGAEPANKAA